MRKISLSPLLLLLIFSHVLITGSFMSIWIFLFSITHELGHMLLMILFGEKIDKIQFRSFGIEIRTRNPLEVNYTKDILIALAGPISNAVLSFVFSILYLTVLPADTIFLFCTINLILCISNLLPLYPLDGGRILYTLLLLYMPMDIAEKRMRQFMLLTVPIMGIVAVWLLLSTGFNISLIAIVMFLSVFISGWTGLGRIGK